MKESAVLKWLREKSWLEEQERLTRVKFGEDCAEIALSGVKLTAADLDEYGKDIQDEWLNKMLFDNLSRQ